MTDQELALNKNLPMIAAVAVALSGCATPQPQAQLAAEDLNVGIAKTCTATPVDLTASSTANASVEMTNDGWCAVHAKDKGGQPFQLGLLRARPQHGRVFIHKIGGETRIEYTAENRYVGSDRFTVSLRSASPNTPDATVQVAVDIARGEGMSAPPPAAAPPHPAAPARASRNTH